MQLNNYIKTKLPLFVALSLPFLFASCGSYQYVGYDNDGIYSDDAVVYEEANSVPVEDNSIYKDYFTEKSIQYSEIPDDGSAIFTNIDDYVGDYDDEASEEIQTGNAGWGASSENITINIIDNGWNNWGFNGGFGWNRGWGFNGLWNRPFWGNGFGWGWNNWGWNPYFGYGYNNWGFGNAWCPPGYGYGYGNFYGNNLAYNNGRRGSNYYGRRSNTTNTGRRSIASTRALGNSSRALTTRSNTRRTLSNTRSNSNTRFNPRTTTRTRTNTRANTRSNTRVTRPQSTRTRTNTSTRSTRTRTNSSSRGNTSRTRVSTPSRSSRSNSSSTRSSSRSSRSSGSSRSSTRSSSSRGGRG